MMGLLCDTAKKKKKKSIGGKWCKQEKTKRKEYSDSALHNM